MGDYYKIKKILLILIIVLTIIRIFKTSNVFATEAVEVTSSWNDGSYTYIGDNQISVLREEQEIIQNNCINQLRYNYDNGAEAAQTYCRATAYEIMNTMASRSSGANHRWVVFMPLTTGSENYSFCFYEINVNATSNVAFHDATTNSGYKLLSVPFFEYTLASYRKMVKINSVTGQMVDVTSGNASIPCAYLGVYSYYWIELFTHMGLYNSTQDYEDLLASIEETNELNYTQNLYTKQAVQNTYNYLTNDSIEEISSLGISQPEISENIDLTDVFDSLESLLTNEDYTSKYFTFSLPGNRNFNFTLRPDYLETSLTRAGGSSIISIIHALWYIGLYGWYIFAYLGIFGKLLTGDLFHLVKGCSPVTNLVKMSVGSITGGKY